MNKWIYLICFCNQRSMKPCLEQTAACVYQLSDFPTECKILNPSWISLVSLPMCGVVTATSDLNCAPLLQFITFYWIRSLQVCFNALHVFLWTRSGYTWCPISSFGVAHQAVQLRVINQINKINTNAIPTLWHQTVTTRNFFQEPMSHFQRRMHHASFVRANKEQK